MVRSPFMITAQSIKSIFITALLAISLPAWASGAGQVFQNPGFNKVVWVESPNQNKRPAGAVVDTIVLHHTAQDSLRTTVNFFATTASKVSAHFCIGKDGSIVQFLSTFDRAWHAGVSTDAYGRKGVNDFSIGIEIDNPGDGKTPYPEAQIRALDNLIGFLLLRFPEVKQITSHEFIAEPQGRKNDPKNFPWDRMKHFGLPLNYGLKVKK